LQGLFSWEQPGAEDWAPYMGNVKIDPLAPLKVGMNFDQKRETGFAPAQPQAVGGGGVGGGVAGVAAQGGMNPLVKKLLGKGKDEIKKYLDEWRKNKDSGFGGDGFEYNADEWSFKDGKLDYHPIDDSLSPRNWTWDAGSGRFVSNNPGVWDAGKYTGSLYDPNNPFGLDDEAWAGLSGLLNSGSLAEEGLGLAKNAGLAGGLSDMGGVADEIAGLGESGSGFMGGAGKALAAVAALKGAYDLTQGGGGKAGADLATGIASYFVPAVGIIKGIFDVGMGIGRYVKSRGRQHDYYHPYVRNQIETPGGYRLMNVGWEDKRNDALKQKMGDNLFSRGQNVIEKDGEYYFLDNVAGYLGLDTWDEYLAANGLARPYQDDLAAQAGMGGTMEEGNWLDEFQKSGLMGERDYQKYLNDAFLHSIATEGINWDSDAIKKAQHGLFKNQDTMGTTWEADNAKRLVRILEMEMLKDRYTRFADISGYKDWQAPELPTYQRQEPEDPWGYDEGYYGM